MAKWLKFLFVIINQLKYFKAVKVPKFTEEKYTLTGNQNNGFNFLILILSHEKYCLINKIS